MSDRREQLRGSLAVVTGASSGIGAAYAQILAQSGANLVLAARRADRLQALAGELVEKFGVEAHVVPVDLQRAEGVAKLFAAATEIGPVQVLVNNAGLGAYGPFLDEPLERHRLTIDVNVTALMDLAHRFGNHMREHQKPSWISNVASLASFQSSPGYAVYSASKYFVRIFSETLAHELRDSAVTISCLCPGGVWTEFMEQVGTEITEKGKKVMMSADAVATIAIDGMLRGKVVVVPGAMNRIAATLPRFVPRELALTVAGRTVARSMRPVEEG